MKLKFAVVASIAALAVVAVVTSASARPQHATAKKASAGGTYRVEWESSFDFTDGFDPTGEYLGDSWGIFSNLMVRTLVTYNHTTGAAGTVIVPDRKSVV